MEIYFLRHASAGKAKLRGKEDEKRPIDEEGEAQSRSVGKLLAQLDVKPEAFISSPLKRAVQTATLVAKEIGFKGDIVNHDALRPDAVYEQFQGLLQEHETTTCIIVTGHNPNISELVSLLISHEATSKAIYLKKGAVAMVEWDGNGQLQWCVTPKLIRAVRDAGIT